MSQRRTLVYSVASVEDSTVKLVSAFSNLSININQVKMPDGTIATVENLPPGTAVKAYLTLNNKVTDAVVDPAASAPLSRPQVPNFAVENQSKRVLAPIPIVVGKSQEDVMEPKTKPKIEYLDRLRSEFYEPVAVYSKRVFPIEVLGEEYETPENENPAFELIKAKCAGVRKCNATDTNGCWIAIAVAYLELLASETTPLADLKAYISLLSKPPLDSHSDQVLRHLYSLEQDKVSPAPLGLAWFERSEILKNVAVWRSFTTLLKRCVETYLRSDTNAQAVLQMSGEHAAFMFSNMLDCQMSIGYNVLAKLLKLKIIILKPEISGWKEVYEGDDENLRRLHLYREMTVFHVLYSEDQLELYGLDLKTGVYRNLWEQSREELVAKKKELVEIRSELQDEFDRCKSSIYRCAELLTSLQSFAADMLSYLSSHPPSSNLLVHIFHMQKVITEVCAATEFPYYNFPSSLKDEVELTKTAVTCSRLQDTLKDEQVQKALNICNNCRENQVKVSLDCGHGFCENCINAYIDVKTKENGLLLKADEQPLSSLRCLLLYCDARISAANLELFLGSTRYRAMVLEAHKQSTRKQCEKCRKSRDQKSFLSLCSGCNVELCIYCHCQSVREEEVKCICGEAYSQHSFEEMRKITLYCAHCNQSYLGKNFSLVECSDHILCQDCLLSSSEELKKCIVCTRDFTIKERKIIDEFADYLCNECWNECRTTRIETLCLCKFCKTCALRKSIEMKQIDTCFACRTPFPLSTAQFLTKLRDLLPPISIA